MPRWLTFVLVVLGVVAAVYLVLTGIALVDLVGVAQKRSVHASGVA